VADVRPDDIWIRLRWCPSRRPRDYPVTIDPHRLLARFLKGAARPWGWVNMELFPASDRPPPAAAAQEETRPCVKP
jgi:hypothetical protein